MDRIEKKIAKARVSLMMDYPFLGHLAMMLEPEEKLHMAMPTMATDGSKLYYDPDFVDNLSINQLMGVIAHEVWHCGLLHIPRQGTRDKKRWNIACVRGDTLVTMADGSQKPITKIVEGEQVIGANGFGTVLLRISKMSDRMVEVNCDSNTLHCTTEHLILTPLGFREAGGLNESTVYRLATRRKRVCLPKLSDNAHQENGRAFTKEFPLGRRFPIKKTFDGAKVLSQTSVETRVNGVTMGISSRDYRWRRNNNYQSTQTIFSSQFASQQYELFAYGNDDIVGFLENCYKEYQRCKSLAYPTWGLANRANTHFAKTIPDNQKRALRFSPPISNTKEAIPQVFNPGDARNSSKNSSFEQTRITVRERIGKTQVYDLVTTCHSYIANGFVVHNCDFADNELIVQDMSSYPGAKLRIELPNGCLIPGVNPPGTADFEGKDAEYIYAHLPDDGGGSGGVGDSSGQTVDSHEEWSQWGKGDGECDSKGDGNEKDGQSQDGQDDQDSSGNMEQEWRGHVAAAATAARMAGKFPGHVEALVGTLLQPKLDWRTILRDMITSAVKSDFQLFPPNKKHLWRGFYLPSLTGESLNIACAIDTSGSISNDDMRDFLTEVKGICDTYSDYTLYLRAGDTHITQKWEIHPFDPLPKMLNGRGGTDYHEFFEEAATLPISCLVVLTDMYPNNGFPKQPFYPVIWVATSDVKAPYGQHIRLPQGDKR